MNIYAPNKKPKKTEELADTKLPHAIQALKETHFVIVVVHVKVLPMRSPGRTGKNMAIQMALKVRRLTYWICIVHSWLETFSCPSAVKTKTEWVSLCPKNFNARIYITGLGWRSYCLSQWLRPLRYSVYNALFGLLWWMQLDKLLVLTTNHSHSCHRCLSWKSKHLHKNDSAEILLFKMD